MYLTEEQYYFLQNIAERCASEDGAGLPQSAILRTLVMLLQHVKVDITWVRAEDELLQRLEEAAEAEILSEVDQIAMSIKSQMTWETFGMAEIKPDKDRCKASLWQLICSFSRTDSLVLHNNIPRLARYSNSIKRLLLSPCRHYSTCDVISQGKRC